MKIIGKTSRGFIIEAERDEAYNLIGYYYHGSKGAPELDIGSEIAVDKMYQQLKKFNSNRDTVATARKYLQGVTDSLALVEPIVARLAENSEQPED